MPQSLGSLHNFLYRILHRNFSNHQYLRQITTTDGKEPLLSFFFHRIYFGHVSPPLTIPGLHYFPTHPNSSQSLFNTTHIHTTNECTNKKTTKIIIKKI